MFASTVGAGLCANRGILFPLLGHVRNDDVRALVVTSRRMHTLLHDICGAGDGGGGGYWSMLLASRFAHVPVAGVRDAPTLLRLYAWAQRRACAETVSRGGGHSLALRGDTDRVVAWDCNSGGQVSGATRAVPAGRRCVQVSAGVWHSLALLDDGRVVGWGEDKHGQVSGAAQAVPAGRRCVQVSAGGYHSLALLDNGRVVGWGSDVYDQVSGLAQALPLGRRCVQVSAGEQHSLALLDNGRVNGWGYDAEGQVSGAAAILPAYCRCVQVSAGHYHSLALLNDGRVIAWGEIEQRCVRTRPQFIAPFGMRSRCVQVSAGLQYSVALLDSGRVVAWGCCGVSGGDRRVTGARFAVPVHRRCVQVSAGASCALALLDDGRVVAWGNILEMDEIDMARRAPFASSVKSYS